MHLSEKLTHLRNAPSRRIVGLMSGTSLDGLDIALCAISGSGSQTRIQLEQFITTPYPADWQAKLKAVSSVPVVDMLELTLIHTELGRLHGQWILDALGQWGVDPSQVDAIASHGQTVFHAPRNLHGDPSRPHATLQIGDGDHIATVTGILTVSDFRQKYTAVGGEGAPMVPFVDDILFKADDETRILLNIGGIANFTVVPPRGTLDGRASTDTGPGNTLIDQLVRRYWPERRFDTDGEIALSCEYDEDLLQAMLQDPWLKTALPRTTGPEYFNIAWFEGIANRNGIALPSPEVQVATATRFSAVTIASALKAMQPDLGSSAMYLSGGGMHNPALIGALRSLLPGLPIRSFSEIGFDPDAKEAVLFAVLANELLAGDGFEWEGQKIVFGKVSG
jgi:anhydro-N-acetylmuramic acid kinase